LETLKIFKDPTEIISRSIQPALWLILFGEAFSRIHMVPTGQVSYLAFLTPGILAQSIAFVSIFNGLAIIWEKDMGILQKILTTPVKRSALVLGKMLASTVRSFSQLIVVIIVASTLGVHLKWSFDRVVGLLGFTILGSVFFTGFSMIIAALVKTRERMMGIGQLVTMPLFFTSSALYPISIMPKWLQTLAKINPLSYLVNGLRGLFLSTSYAQGTDIGILLMVSLLVWIWGTIQYPRLLI
jgi:ABC-2 type transport system permease protein